MFGQAGGKVFGAKSHRLKQNLDEDYVARTAQPVLYNKQCQRAPTVRSTEPARYFASVETLKRCFKERVEDGNVMKGPFSPRVDPAKIREVVIAYGRRLALETLKQVEGDMRREGVGIGGCRHIE
jgi:hypothetical protein